jgi:HSP20 family molecular chaperone IbpA
MTKTLTLRSLDIPTIHKFGIGFDSMFNELLRSNELQTSTYPPYNIVKYDDNNFSIELAVAGFKEGQLDIELENNQLTIVGDRGDRTVSEYSSDLPQSDTKQPYYAVHGISSRSFSRTFTLAQNVIVTGAAIADGILTVKLLLEVPEDSKPKKIVIARNK